MSSVEFDHFLITRFNTRLKERASDEWLKHRLEYFRSMCIPSIKAQSVQAFKWLVYFDAERDQWFEDEVNTLAAGLFEPVWVEGKFDPKACAEDVAARTSKPWVITTRMDNDDALAVDFVELVQSHFAERTEFINFTAGLQLTDDGKLVKRSDPSNAFISLIEPSAEPMGVYVDWHNKVSAYAPVRQVAIHPMWVQMVHGKNIANATRGIRAEHALLAKYFAVERVAAPVGKLALRFHQAMSAMSLALRVVSKPHRIVWMFKVLRARLGLG